MTHMLRLIAGLPEPRASQSRHTTPGISSPPIVNRDGRSIRRWLSETMQDAGSEMGMVHE